MLTSLHCFYHQRRQNLLFVIVHMVVKHFVLRTTECLTHYYVQNYELGILPWRQYGQQRQTGIFGLRKRSVWEKCNGDIMESHMRCNLAVVSDVNRPGPMKVHNHKPLRRPLSWSEVEERHFASGASLGVKRCAFQD